MDPEAKDVLIRVLVARVEELKVVNRQQAQKLEADGLAIEMLKEQVAALSKTFEERLAKLEQTANEDQPYVVTAKYDGVEFG